MFENDLGWTKGQIPKNLEKQSKTEDIICQLGNDPNFAVHGNFIIGEIRFGFDLDCCFVF